MKTANIVKAVCVASLAATCAWGLAACSTGNATTESAGTGAIAGTVNGVEVSEDEITGMIEGIRAQMSLQDADTWGQWMADNAMTPEGIREEMFNSFVQQELVKQGAEEKGITVESSEVDAIVNNMKATNYENDDAKWQTALSQAGMSEEEYRESLESQLAQRKLSETFAADEEPSQEDLLQYSQMYASAYDGAKRSSHILFDAADEETAKSVLEQINAGTLDFAEAAKQYSKDTVSAEQSGDVGWDKMSQFDTDYVNGLTELEKDQVSELITSQFGIHIIKCTDVFAAPEEVTNIDQIPAEFLSTIKTQLTQQKQSTAYQAWLEEYKGAADIVLNDMPEGLPYMVDMSKYTPAEDSPAASSDDAAADGAADGSSDAPAEDTAENPAPEEGAASDADTNTEQEAPSAEQPVEGEENKTQQPAEAA